MTYLIVFVGGGIGAALRHAVNRGAIILLGPSFPFGTFFVNVLGSFLMGVLAAVLLARGEGDQSVRLFLGTGILGGFTTFSAFSLDLWLMLARGTAVPALGYALLSVVGSLAMLVLGVQAARALA
jgi:fluoride exporter